MNPAQLLVGGYWLISSILACFGFPWFLAIGGFITAADAFRFFEDRG